MTPFFGVYRATCVNNVDPERRGRLLVRVPEVLGQETSNWAMPCVPPGWSQALLEDHAGGGHAQMTGSGVHAHPHKLRSPVPAREEGLWVMFEGGDRERPVWIGTWRAT